MPSKLLTQREFERDLRKLLLAYGGSNADDDPNIEVTVVDRRTHERLHFQPQPYHPWSRSKVTLEEHQSAIRERLRIAKMNLGLAADQAAAAMRDVMETQVIDPDPDRKAGV